ncbi:glycosyltransferase family 4 protein [Umboniibacter marinipuniceus]|uniref:Glycosyltransferase involved in cell wall biosynthesis n=1 Tax=Umboniibacter marinipuniceus TaxID=569599 RepID=A0A3M0A576_9GAMM|nr:glycosyltransferase family 4 protein [Umboniibacter marinipuniceus]RMA80193.1 glycosyltransferase involved in cell wall biosynthesis [Umboniibacter marinipuniceus]
MDSVAHAESTNFDLGSPESGPAITSTPLKICLLGYRSAPLSGGQGIYLKYLSQALVERGHQVDVISGEPYPELDPRVNLIKLPGLNLFQYYPKQWQAFRWNYLRSLTDLSEYLSVATGGFPEPRTFGRRLAKYFRQNKPRYDVIHDNQSLCYGLLALAKQGYPLVATFHHPITRDLKLALAAEDDWRIRLLIRRWHSFLRMQKRVVPKLRNVVAVSQVSREDICSDFKLTADHLGLVYNGIDTVVFSPDETKSRFVNTLVCTASADAPLKGLKYLLQALAKLRHSNPDIRLILVGRPKPDGDNAKLINQLGLTDIIDIRSRISTEELVGLYQQATIVVCPSLYEGFGLPAGEAMACGTPVVSARGGALPEVVGDAGVLVPTADAEALASAIESLLADPVRRDRLGAAGRLRIEQQFSWQVAASQFEQLYVRAMNDANS